MARTMVPSDANPYGNVHGGEVMKLIDAVAGAAATRHARARVVTARIDELSFLAPVYVGHLVTAKASVNHVGKTSMEIGVRVEAEDMLTATSSTSRPHISCSWPRTSAGSRSRCRRSSPRPRTRDGGWQPPRRGARYAFTDPERPRLPPYRRGGAHAKRRSPLGLTRGGSCRRPGFQ